MFIFLLNNFKTVPSLVGSLGYMLSIIIIGPLASVEVLTFFDVEALLVTVAEVGLCVVLFWLVVTGTVVFFWVVDAEEWVVLDVELAISEYNLLMNVPKRNCRMTFLKIGVT